MILSIPLYYFHSQAVILNFWKAGSNSDSSAIISFSSGPRGTAEKTSNRDPVQLEDKFSGVIFHIILYYLQGNILSIASHLVGKN